MSVKDELDELGKNIAKDAKKNALPNKKTGKLDRSIKYDYTFISNEKFQLVINEIYYGKYLNSGHDSFKGTQYMDKAIDKNLNNGVNSITNAIVGDIMNDIKNKL